MIHKPLPFKDLNIRIPIIIPMEGRGFIIHGSGLGPTLRPAADGRSLPRPTQQQEKSSVITSAIPPTRVGLGGPEKIECLWLYKEHIAIEGNKTTYNLNWVLPPPPQ